MKNKKTKNEELGRLTVNEYNEKEKYPVIIILDNVRSLHNVGSVFRTADAFLIEEVILCGITATPPHREIRKTALGATESVKWSYENDTIDAVERLKKKGYQICGVEQTSESIKLGDISMNPNNPKAVIFGHEVNGIQEEIISRCDRCLEIPQMGTKHSFNISVSAGIVLWEIFRKHIK